MPTVDWSLVATVAWGTFVGLTVTGAILGSLYMSLDMARDNIGAGVAMWAVLFLPLAVLIAGVILGVMWAAWTYVPLAVMWVLAKVAAAGR